MNTPRGGGLNECKPAATAVPLTALGDQLPSANTVRICKKLGKNEGGPSVKAALNLLVLRKSLKRSTLSGRSLGAGITFCHCLSCSLPSNAFYFLLT
jgi:hypothetical protein